jgi:hypothetical protein
MKKLERLDGKLFSSLEEFELQRLQNFVGGVKTATGNQGGGPTDNCFTSSITSGYFEVAARQAAADTTSWCDDSCLDRERPYVPGDTWFEEGSWDPLDCNTVLSPENQIDYNFTFSE